MQWRELLSQKRDGEEPSDEKLKSDLRSEFEKDCHRIIGSASFRRLQDKTQVFPLDKSDFIRTRLTHSLEVSSLGRSLAQNISASILEQKLDPDFTAEMKSHVSEILECAGLIHDIGNPPFGHFGEEAIREWFGKHLTELATEGKPVRELLTEQEMNDLYHFEGNAQGLRLVSRLHYLSGEHGMNLTFGLLSAVIKYPNSSLEIRSGSSDVTCRKMGYFKSEEEIFRKVEKETGLNGRRSPLAFILEAADDIAYATADIEDALKKGFFDYPVFSGELKKRRVAAEYTDSLGRLYSRALSCGLLNPPEYAVRNWLVKMQNSLIAAATEGFISHYAALMEGSYTQEIIGGQAAELLSALKGIAYDYAFTSMSIYKTEIAANTILTSLLDQFVPAALAYDCGKKPGLMEEKFLSLISDNYKQVYRRFSENKPESEKIYLKLLLVTDVISGMTDSYARDLYTDLNGISF